MKQSSESSAVLFETESAAGRTGVSIGIWQRVRHRSRRRRVCRRARTPRKSIRLAFTPSSSAARPSPRRAQPTAAPGPTASAPRSRTALRRNRPTQLIRSGPFTEVPTPPNQLRWDPLPMPTEQDRFRRRHRHPGRQRRPGHADWRRHSSLCRQRLHAGPLLLQRRRRDADRAAAGRAALPHRTRHSGGCARRDLRDSARHQVPRGARWKSRPAATSARTTACPSACPNSAPSAPTVWPIRAISHARRRL